LRRFVEISAALGGCLGWELAARLGIARSTTSRAQRLSKTLDRLGTTFIKLGQGLSLHREFLPDDYVLALQNLQDHTSPFPAEIAIREVELALSRKINDCFAEFEPLPIAAASVAQVHRARLRDGREVVVKVRRPSIKWLVEQDLRLLRATVRVVVWVVPNLKKYDPLGLIDEIRDNLHKEMDFRYEARNILRFKEAFKDSETIYVPGVIGEFVTESVIVQEMSGGQRVDDPQVKAIGPRLAQAFIDAYLRQIFVLGVFHADPHPGNLFVTPDRRICFHDFGSVGTLDRATRRNFAALLQAFVHQDSDWLLDACLDLGLLGGEIDRRQCSRELNEIIEDYAKLPLKEWSLAEALMRFARIGRGRSLRLPRRLLALIRALAEMEGVVRTLDPEFNLVGGLMGGAEKLAATFVDRASEGKPEERLRYEAAAALQEIPDALSALARKARTEGFKLAFSVDELDGLNDHIEGASKRIAFALIALGLYIAASLLMQHSLGPTIGGIPVAAVIGYALALWITYRVLRDR
jgi:ubiquinone biosynthesis protein